MKRTRRLEDDTAVLMVPIYDERQQGADLLMFPVSDESRQQPQQPQLQPQSEPPKQLPQPPQQQQQQTPPQQPLPQYQLHVTPQPRQQQQQQPQRIETPTARPPTPPPKPQLPLECEDWDDYIMWRRAAEAASLSDQQQQQQQQHGPSSSRWRKRLLHQHQHQHQPPTAPKEDILRGFEEWKEYLAASRAASRRGGRPISIISTSTTSTTTTTTTTTGGRSFKRSSMCSISSTKSGKPRSLRRCSRSRHLRAYYSEGSLSTARNNQRVDAPLKETIVNVDHVPRGRPQFQPRQPTSHQSLRASWVSESCGPPPHPPPDKPLPALPPIIDSPVIGSPIVDSFPVERRAKRRNRSLLDERERKRFHRVYWH